MHKRGEVLVLGGEAITGASRMTTLAASRAGAGMVTLAAPEPVWSIYATSLINAIVHSFAGASGWQALLADKRRNVIAIRPGAGVGAPTLAYVAAALGNKRATVLDADALTSFAEAPEDLFSAIDGPFVMTPHAGEFMRLFQGEGDKRARTRAAAKQSGAVVLLKRPDTVIAAPDGRSIIKANAPAQLATGGTGDVFTGFIAALPAQGMAPFEAAAAGVWLHGAAAAGLDWGGLRRTCPMRCRASSRSSGRRSMASQMNPAAVPSERDKRRGPATGRLGAMVRTLHPRGRSLRRS